MSDKVNTGSLTKGRKPGRNVLVWPRKGQRSSLHAHHGRHCRPTAAAHHHFRLPHRLERRLIIRITHDKLLSQQTTLTTGGRG